MAKGTPALVIAEAAGTMFLFSQREAALVVYPPQKEDVEHRMLSPWMGRRVRLHREEVGDPTISSELFAFVARRRVAGADPIYSAIFPRIAVEQDVSCHVSLRRPEHTKREGIVTLSPGRVTELDWSDGTLRQMNDPRISQLRMGSHDLVALELETAVAQLPLNTRDAALVLYMPEDPDIKEVDGEKLEMWEGCRVEVLSQELSDGYERFGLEQHIQTKRVGSGKINCAVFPTIRFLTDEGWKAGQRTTRCRVMIHGHYGKERHAVLTLFAGNVAELDWSSHRQWALEIPRAPQHWLGRRIPGEVFDANTSMSVSTVDRIIWPDGEVSGPCYGCAMGTRHSHG